MMALHKKNELINWCQTKGLYHSNVCTQACFCQTVSLWLHCSACGKHFLMHQCLKPERLAVLYQWATPCATPDLNKTAFSCLWSYQRQPSSTPLYFHQLDFLRAYSLVNLCACAFYVYKAEWRVEKEQAHAGNKMFNLAVLALLHQMIMHLTVVCVFKAMSL